MGKKRQAIELLRFVFSIIIVLYHTWDYFEAPVHFIGGYIAVDFFFVLSGFFLFRSASAVSPPSSSEDGSISKATLDYTFRRIRRLYPEYLFAFLLQFWFMNLFVWNNTVYSSIKNGFDAIWTLLFLNMAGLGIPTYNGPTWYLSSMLIAGFLLYYLIKKNAPLFQRIIAPLSILVIYSYFNNTVGHTQIAIEYYGIACGGTIRAIAGMSLGCISYAIYRKLDKLTFTAAGKIVLSIVEAVLCCGILVAIYQSGFTKGDFLIILGFSVWIPLVISQKSFLSQFMNNKFSSWLGTISYSIFLNHRLILLLFISYFKGLEYYQMVPLYLISVLLFGVTAHYFVHYIQGKVGFLCKRIWNKMTVH